MASLPDSRTYLVVRTYFDDDAGWRALRRVINKGSEEGVFATVEYVNDRQCDVFTSDALEAVHPYREEGWAVMYVADERAIREPSHPLLLVKVGGTEELPFRFRADRLAEVDANLSTANLD